MKKIKVSLKQSKYNIYIGRDSLLRLAGDVNSSSVAKCLIVIDRNVERHHLSLLRALTANFDVRLYRHLFRASEGNKNLSQVNHIYRILAENYFGRDSIIISLGGGITGDLVSFAASTYMRGIKFYQVPTTLLAMIDSSVGGKTGVNFSLRKNIIGSFHQPSGVYILSDFLKTLPEREIVSGAGELFKYAFLADDENYSLVRNTLKKIFERRTFNPDNMIHSCLKIKSGIVSGDEKEITGLRKILNLGHTFAHAFESVSGFKLKHGEAVIGGLYSAMFFSECAGFMSKETLKRILSDFGFILPHKLLKDMDAHSVYRQMLSDKKNSGGRINLVLPEDIGKILIDIPADRNSINAAVERMKSLI